MGGRRPAGRRAEPARSGTVAGVSTFGPLVSPEWLQEHLADADLRIIDFRWYQDGRSGKDAYVAGHVPGALFVDLEGDVTGPRPGAGR